MLFRYKIVTCTYEALDRAFHGPGVGYRVTIQYYKPDAKLFNWRHFKSTRLDCVLNRLGHDDDAMNDSIGFANALHTYNDIGEIMLKYIKQIMADINNQKLKDMTDNQNDQFVLTTGWNNIEIKENE
jgi:hypothetical protein